MGFFGILLIIFASLWLLGRLLPYLLALLIARQGRKMFGGAGGGPASGAGTRGGGKSSRKEGEITVESVGEDKSAKISKQVGDYVDYQEQ